MTPKRERPSFRQAVIWMALNDDTEWVREEGGIPSVTACLTADLFGRTEDEVRRALERQLKTPRK